MKKIFLQMEKENAEMNKLKLFLENFIVYGFSGIISKIIPLVMVPIVTRLMPSSSYYGISDMANTVISFASSLAVMGMYDAMYRMFFEKEDVKYKKSICSTAFLFTVVTSLIVFFIMLLLKDILADLFFDNREYSYLIYICAIATLVGATNSIVSAPTRMQNRKKTYVFMNTISPIMSYSISIPLLLSGHYILALPIAALISATISEAIFLYLNRGWFSLKKIDYTYLKQLLLIGLPLLPNFLIYWIFNSSDKLMITNLLGTDATGIYSVGAKLGQASQLIYTAFAGGWQYFAFSTMNEKDQVKTNSAVFEYLGIISFACSSFVFALAKPIYSILFTGVYVQGFIISPYLFLAPLLQMLFQVACNQFLVIKKTWPNFFILSSGAIINVILNFYLIPLIGIEGAAIATLIGYVVSDVIVVLVLTKMKLMIISPRFILCVAVMIGFILLWRMVILESTLVSVGGAAICSGLFIYIYRTEIKKLFGIIKK